MNDLNTKLIRIIDGYDPDRKDVLCKIDIIKLSQMEALQNPSNDKKEVVEAFLDYATAVVEKHPTSCLNETIEKMFGSALEKMQKVAPEAYQKYQDAQIIKQPNMMMLKKREYTATI